MRAFFFLLTWGAVISAALGAAGAWWKVTSPIAGLALCGLGLVLSALAVLWGLVALVKSEGKLLIFLFWLLHGGAIAGTVYLLLPAQEHPITDVSTDTKNPPPFLEKAYAATVDHGAELLTDLPLVDRSYVTAFAAQQTALYPDIRPIKIRTKEARPVFEMVLKGLKGEMPGLTLVAHDPEKFLIEGRAESDFFHFVDDIAIRITAPNPKDPEPAVIIDIRSRSRGLIMSDLGANAARVREVTRAIRSVTSALIAEETKARKASTPATGTSASLKPASGTTATVK